ncbi:MAG: excinuclease ABC subunit B [Flavobacteriales bacterium]|nr:excinuclease ABC subunit B [Flavobacteriales bacterium]
MMFQLNATYHPTGDQPEAIQSLQDGLNKNTKHQCLKGVTGSGKTFTIANVIKNYNQPVLVLCHNKTLAAQLYEEFKLFFPHNSVEYFVSYYDYYQPEAYLPATNTYIEKDLSINEEIEKFRMKATTSLLSGKNDVIVVASVSCIYGIGNPVFFQEKTITIKSGEIYQRKDMINDLIEALYTRTKDADVKKGQIKMTGDTLKIHPTNEDVHYKIHFWGNQVDFIEKVNLQTQQKTQQKQIQITPANIFITSKDNIKNSIVKIKNELTNQVKFFIKNHQHNEAKRIEERVNYDLEMIQELGYCTGIENYSRYLDGRKEGERPFCLMDYFPDNFLLIIDESHVTIPQVKAMYGGDKSRKSTLVEYGFRLPSALDNRPLSFEEFENINKQTIYVSATPSDYELLRCEKNIIEQVIRPTGLLEPEIMIRESKNQIDDLLNEIDIRIKKKERVLVTTLTKKMAEQLSKYLIDSGINATYIHSDIDTIARIEIMKNLRLGTVDVLIGVNLLREGLDLPEVSLVAIMDADKEGFLRSKKSLIQTIGRAARHIHGQSILYADHITQSMQDTINETNRKREIQQSYNIEHGITPKPLQKKVQQNTLLETNNAKKQESISSLDIKSLSIKELKEEIKTTRKLMNSSAISMNFIDAAQHRDKMFILEKQLKKIN